MHHVSGSSCRRFSFAPSWRVYTYFCAVLLVPKNHAREVTARSKRVKSKRIGFPPTPPSPIPCLTWVLRCTAGNFCSSAASPEQACESGTYSAALATSCTPCPEGYACPSTTGRVICDPGTYSVGDATECTPCPAGYYCTNTGAAEFTECPDGTYSTGGATSCQACAAGNYCPSKTVDNELACPGGTYSTGSAMSCTSCPAGSGCTAAGIITVCEAGYYSVDGASDCVACPAGSRCPYTHLVSLCRANVSA